MLLVNFGVFLEEEDIKRIEETAKQAVSKVVYQPFFVWERGKVVPQVQEVMEFLDITPREWSGVVLVIPPKDGVVTAVLLAEMYKRMGKRFPLLVRMGKRLEFVDPNV